MEETGLEKCKICGGDVIKEGMLICPIREICGCRNVKVNRQGAVIKTNQYNNG